MEVNDNIKKNRDFAIQAVFSFILLVITAAIVSKLIFAEDSDYNIHSISVLQGTFWDNGYPLWHFGVWVLYKLFRIPVEFASPIFSGLINVIVYSIICFYIRKHCPVIPELLAFCLCFMTAIYVPWYNASIYIGQGSPVCWHNPTTLMVKPFSYIIFFMTVVFLEERGDERSWKHYLPAAILALISMLAKPSFFQGFVPALGFYMLIDLFSKYKGKVGQWFSENYRICLVFLPSALLIVGQLSIWFNRDTALGGGIGIKWGYAVSKFTPNIFISALLTYFFPLMFLIIYFKKILSDVKLKLAYVFALVTWIEANLLYEKGERYYHGNFIWAGQIALSLLWLVTTIEFFKEYKDADNNNKPALIKTRTLLIIWLVHLTCGFIYAGQMLFIKDLYY